MKLTKCFLYFFIVLFLILCVYGFLIGHFSFKASKLDVSQSNLSFLHSPVISGNSFYTYPGVLCVHSSLNHGSASQEKILNIANEESLSFVGFLENLQNSVHTRNRKVFRFSHSDLRQDLVVDINLRKVWKLAWNERRSSFISSLFFYPFNRNLAFLNLYTQDTKTLESWKNTPSKINYLCSDARSKFKVFKDFHIKFPSYSQVFMLAKNHIVLRKPLSGHKDQDKKILLSALNKGQFFYSLDLLGVPKGFSFFANHINSQSKTLMGNMISQESLKPIELTVTTPLETTRPLKIQIFRNGFLVKETLNQKSIKFKTSEAGYYKTLISTKPSWPWPFKQKWVPWVFSNAIEIN